MINPLEATVVASAPGKVILFGEHAVVYGKMAVAAAVSDMRIVVEAVASSDEHLHLELPDLGDADGKPLCLHRPIKDIASFFAGVLAKGAKPQPPSTSHLDLLQEFLGDFEAVEKKALLPLTFLCLSLVPSIFLEKTSPNTQGLSVTTFSASLPVGGGLGSSAAFCVASSAALMRLEHVLGSGGNHKALDNSNGSGGTVGGDQCTRPPPEDLNLINSWAFAAETLLHGNPSGLDNTVSCFGGAIRYLRQPMTTDAIEGFPNLDILLTNTLVPRETRALLAGVGRLRERFPEPTDLLFSAIEGVGTAFLEGAAKASLSADDIGRLAAMNHNLLCALGVSHRALDRVKSIAGEYDCHSKLTGAGGGGCALTVLGEGLAGRKEELVSDLEAEGYKCYESSLGGVGVLWHDSIPKNWVRMEAAVEKARGKAPEGQGKALTWLVAVSTIFVVASAATVAAVVGSGGRGACRQS